MTDRFVKKAELRQMLGGVSATSIHRYIKRGVLPPPVYLGGFALWRQSVLDKALANLPERYGRAA